MTRDEAIEIARAWPEESPEWALLQHVCSTVAQEAVEVVASPRTTPDERTHAGGVVFGAQSVRQLVEELRGAPPDDGS